MLSRYILIVFSALLLSFNIACPQKQVTTEHKHIVATKKTFGIPKIVWSFFENGASEMPAFYQLNLESWHKLLGSTWTIKVLNLIPSDPLYIGNFISRDEFPSTFELLPLNVKSDAVRLAFLKKFGGVWMDPSNILLKPIEEFCSPSQTSGERTICAFYHEDWRSNRLGDKDYVESWFIATLPAHPLIAQWYQTFNAYWKKRTTSLPLEDYPFYQKVDLDEATRSHLCQGDYSLQSVEQKNLLLYSARTPFFITSQMGWNSLDISHQFLNEKNMHFINEIFKTTPLIIFTTSMMAEIKNKSKSELTDPNYTLGEIYKRLDVL